MLRGLVLCALLIVGACAHDSQRGEKGERGPRLEYIVEGEHRSQANRDRNAYRNPVETLRFFGVRPGMTVVEVSPGRGWYTEILGPYLKRRGTLYLASFDLNSEHEFRRGMAQDIRDLVQENPKLFGDVHFTTFELPATVGPLAPESSADRVLTFRNFHGVMRANKEREVLQEFYRVLKPGGVLGIVQHRERPDRTQDPQTRSGYVREDLIIELAESIGFEFVAKSEINANYLDTKDHEHGVWSLPPTLRDAGGDRARLLAIGESDRMTLKFRRPKN